MTEKYSNVRLSVNRIKPVSQGKGRAESDWTILTKRHCRKRRNGYKKNQFIVGVGGKVYQFGRIDDIHSIAEVVNGKPVGVVVGRFGKIRVKKSGDAVGVGPGGSTVGRWVEYGR